MAILTVDIGTTSTKVILFDDRLNQIDVIKKEYPTQLTEAGFAEQDPVGIFEAVLTGMGEFLTDQSVDVSTIVFSSAMHSLLGVDSAGEPLTPLVIWSDHRAVGQVDRLKSEPEAVLFFQKTGTPIHPMSPFAKLLWFKEESERFNQVAKWIGIKEYIWFRLTGAYEVDYSIASATGLFNSEDMVWDAEVLRFLGLDEASLSVSVDVTYSRKVTDPDVLKLPGIDEETQLVIGGSDGCLANLASVSADTKVGNLTLGTSGAIRLTTRERVLDPEGRLFCYYLQPGEWVVGGAVNNGGNVLNWLDRLLFEEPGRIYQMLETIDFSHETELVFLPHIHGERAPFWDSHLMGEWLGLTAVHQKQDLIRSAIEGILFNLYDVFNLLSEQAGGIKVLTVSGGFFQNQTIIQVVANLSGLQVQLNQTIEQSSLGAAMLVQSDVQAIDADVTTYLPDEEEHDNYQKKYAKYQQALKQRGVF